MKVIQITTFFHPITGGVESHVYELAKDLIAKGFETEVWCSNSGKGAKNLKEFNSQLGSLKIRRFRTWFSLSYYHKFYPGLIWALLRAKYDLIHVHRIRSWESYAALFIARLRKKRVVLTTHNPFPTSTRSKMQNLLIKIHDLTFGRWWIRKFDKIIAIVDSEREILKQKFKVGTGKVTVIPNGLADEYYQPGDAQAFLKEWKIEKEKWQGLVIGAGRINYAKGFQNLEAAVRSLPKVLFFISGGDDGYLTKLKAQYATYENIIFSERYLQGEKYRDLFAAADVFVFPSLHEAFGIVLLEAMAQKSAIISTNVGGPNDILHDDMAIKIKPDDAQAWTESIKQLLRNEKLRASMVEKARLEVEKYRWSKLTEKIIKVYKQIA